MTIAFWIIRFILAIKCLTITYTHGFRQSLPSMQEASKKLGRFSHLLLYFISAAAFFAASGLILPDLLGVSKWISPSAAGLLSIMLICSLLFHLKAREKPKLFVSAVLCGMALFVVFFER
jgi:hypothetical protein